MRLTRQDKSEIKIKELSRRVDLLEMKEKAREEDSRWDKRLEAIPDKYKRLVREVYTQRHGSLTDSGYYFCYDTITNTIASIHEELKGTCPEKKGKK